MPKIIGKVNYGCPICNGKVTGSCKCIRADSQCENGHQWHTCTVHKVYVEGHSDHSTDTNTCTCGEDPIDYEEKARKMMFSDFGSSAFTSQAVEKLATILEKADKFDSQEPVEQRDKPLAR